MIGILAMEVHRHQLHHMPDVHGHIKVFGPRLHILKALFPSIPSSPTPRGLEFLKLQATMMSFRVLLSELNFRSYSVLYFNDELAIFTGTTSQ